MCSTSIEEERSAGGGGVCFQRTYMGEGHGAGCCEVGVDSCDAGDEEVGFCEVEVRGEEERGNARGGVDLTFASG